MTPPLPVTTLASVGRTSFSAIVPIAVVLAGCGGKVLDGTCSPDGSGGWVCTSFGDASATPLDIAQCPSNSDPSGSCASSTIGGPSTPPTQGQPGFVGVYGASSENCFTCDSSGHGTHWTCDSAGWQAAGYYTCRP
jgi:hypothetical protein